MQLRIYEKVTMRPNGDRDTTTHPCSEFRVDLIRGDKRTTIFKNNQFDPWWTSIRGTRKEYLKEAVDAAEAMSQVLGTCEIVGVNVTRDEVRAEELRRSIERDKTLLEELERKIR